MNSTWKNILITVVIAIWLGFIGYALSCFVAYIIGWPPFVAPIVFTIIALLALVTGFVLRKKNDVSSLFFVLFYSLFISSLANSIILGVKFSDLSYHGAIIADAPSSHCYLYNKWGWKILNIGGMIKYEDSYVYLMTNSEVYVFDYDGELIQSADLIVVAQYGHATILQQPFTQKYFIKGSKVEKKAYDDYEYLGETDINDCFKGKTNGLWQLVMVRKKTGYCEIKYHDAQEIEEYGYPIKCFVIKDGKKYKILNDRGHSEYSTNKGIYGAYYDASEKQLNYEDEDGKRWYHQF